MKDNFQEFFSDSILKFESMIKSNKFLFFDIDEFESIIIYYLESGNSSMANKAIKMAVDQYPNNTSILLLKVEALIFENKIEEAEKIIDLLFEFETNNSEIIIQKSRILSKRKKHTDSIDLLKKIKKDCEFYSDALIMIGKEYLFIDDFENAKEKFNEYINSSEGPLYRKSNILYGLNFAKEAIRSAKSIVMVEGYFDVLACHRVGIKNVVAVSGTALTQEHVHILKRNAETVVLCLDQDRAGKEAAQRAFILCSPEELHVHTVQVPDKDPDETAARDPKLLNQLLSSGGVPYLDKLANDLLEKDLNSIQGKREAMELIVPLLNSIGSSVEREHYINKFASVLSTTNVVLKEDLSRLEKQKIKTPINKSEDNELEDARKKQFSKLEVSLGLFCTYPKHLGLLDQLIPPDDGMPSRLYAALKDFSGGYETLSPKTLDITDEDRERLSILLLYCEESDLSACRYTGRAGGCGRDCKGPFKGQKNRRCLAFRTLTTD